MTIEEPLLILQLLYLLFAQLIVVLKDYHVGLQLGEVPWIRCLSEAYVELLYSILEFTYSSMARCVLILLLTRLLMSILIPLLLHLILKSIWC